MKPISKQWPDCSRACALLVFLTIAGCQQTGTLQTESAQSREIQTLAGLILLAEAELSAGNTDQAIRLYLQAAAKSSNPEVSAAMLYQYALDSSLFV